MNGDDDANTNIVFLHTECDYNAALRPVESHSGARETIIAGPYYIQLEVDRILASVSVSAPNVDKWALSADIRFRPKVVVPHSVHFRFWRAAVGKFGGCRKQGTELELRRQRMRRTQGVISLTVY